MTFSIECKEARLISKTNILLPPQIIAVVLTESIKNPTTSGTKDNIENVIVNPFLCIDNPSLYIIPTVYIFQEKEVKRMLLLTVNLGHDKKKS